MVQFSILLLKTKKLLISLSSFFIPPPHIEKRNEKEKRPQDIVSKARQNTKTPGAEYRKSADSPKYTKNIVKKC